MRQRLLYILPGLVPPELDPERNKFVTLSQVIEGDVLWPVWWASDEEALQKLGPEHYPELRLGRFNVHYFLFNRVSPWLRGLARFWFYLSRGLLLLRGRGRESVIVSYGWTAPAWAGLVLKLLTGAKLIVEVPGAPDKAFLYDEPSINITARIKRALSIFSLLILGPGVDRFKLLYPTQLKKFSALARRPASVFHDFVPVGVIRPKIQPEKVILTVGHPWFLKGIDVLIRAFQRIGSEFPDYRLKIVGFIPDPRSIDELVVGSGKIEISPPLPYELVLDTISSCSLFVLASRTEAMGRVLLEAMAARRPIIASRVDGIPYYLQDNETALLFEPGNVEELAAKMLLALKNRELSGRISDNAYLRVRRDLDEYSYADHFRRMLRALEGENESLQTADEQAAHASNGR